MATDANDEPFTLHETGETTGETWSGEFRAKKRLSHRDQLRKDQVRRELLGGQPGVPSDRALSTAVMLSELAVRLTQVPKWWTESGNGVDLEDDVVVSSVYTQALKVEADAAEAQKKRAEEVQKRLREEAEKARKAEEKEAKG